MTASAWILLILMQVGFAFCGGYVIVNVCVETARALKEWREWRKEKREELREGRKATLIGRKTQALKMCHGRPVLPRPEGSGIRMDQ